MTVKNFIKIESIYDYLNKIPKSQIPWLSILLIILLSVIDYITGYEISFSIFYLIPVFIVSWFGEKNHAAIVSTLSSATWLLMDVLAGHVYPHPLIALWNAAMRLGFFLIVSFLILKIKEILKKEQTFARIDYLTGVTNNRAFKEMAKNEINRCTRFDRPLTIAYIDIDNFKQVNDTLGHSHGDILLKLVAEKIKNNIRSMDIVSRLGGDEFAILFPEINEENAKTAINKVRNELLNMVKNNNWPISFSIGVVTCYQSCDLDELIKKADNLMYSVKIRGKNSVKFDIHDIPVCQQRS